MMPKYIQIGVGIIIAINAFAFFMSLIDDNTSDK